MTGHLLDVDLIVQHDEVKRGGGFESMLPDFIKQMRHQAELKAELVGGQIRTTVQPHFQMNDMESPLLGPIFAMSTRWVIDVPDGVHVEPER